MDAYMADRPLVEGEICATMDLRRSVMMAVVGVIYFVEKLI